MKHSTRILSLLILVSGALIFSGCDKGGDNKKSEKQQQIDLLVGTWNIQSVSDGSDKTADFPNFKLDLTANGSEGLNYTAQNRMANKLTIWPANGTFTFGTPIATQLLRDDSQTFTYSVSANSLTLQVNYSGDGYTPTGRTESVSGTWIFTFTK